MNKLVLVLRSWLGMDRRRTQLPVPIERRHADPKHAERLHVRRRLDDQAIRIRSVDAQIDALGSSRRFERKH